MMKGSSLTTVKKKIMIKGFLCIFFLDKLSSLLHITIIGKK